MAPTRARRKNVRRERHAAQVKRLTRADLRALAHRAWFRQRGTRNAEGRASRCPALRPSSCRYTRLPQSSDRRSRFDSPLDIGFDAPIELGRVNGNEPQLVLAGVGKTRSAGTGVSPLSLSPNSPCALARVQPEVEGVHCSSMCRLARAAPRFVELPIVVRCQIKHHQFDLSSCIGNDHA
jgi:hypothetical protein